MGIRTTVTLDEDVFSRMKEESRKQGKAFKEVLNNTLRRGLLRPDRPAEPFALRTFQMGERPGLNYDCMGEMLEQVEGPLHK